MIRAVCALIFDIDGKILTVSRKDNPNDIGLPGGKVDEGESLEDAIKREVLEETGFTVSVLAPVYSGIEGNYKVTTFICVINKGITYKVPSQKETGIVSMESYKKLLYGSFRKYNTKLLKAINLI